MVDKSGSEHKRRLTASFKEWAEADMSKSTKELAKTLFKVADRNLEKENGAAYCV